MDARSVAQLISRILASRTTKQTRVLGLTRRDGATAQRLAVAASIWARRAPHARSAACGAHFVVATPRNIRDIACGELLELHPGLLSVAPARDLFRGSLTQRSG